MARRREPMKARLSATLIASITVPDGQDRLYIHDTDCAGLCVMKTRAGASAFYLYRWIDGRPVRLRLGDTSSLKVDQARKLADDAKARILQGVDPQAAKKAKRTAPTVAELWTAYLERHLKPHARPSTRADDCSMVKHLAPIWQRRANTITHQDVIELHRSIGAKTRGRAKAKGEAPKLTRTANKVVRLLRRIYRWNGLPKPYRDSRDAGSFPWFDQVKRERYLTPEEIGRFDRALDNEDADFADLFRLALLTGARKSALLSMKWEDVDLASGLWRLPAERSKSKTAVIIALAPAAVGILTKRFELRDTVDAESPRYAYVFPARRVKHPDRDDQHLREPRFALRRVLKAAGIGGVRFHDLRRTFGSTLAAQGANEATIAAALGHKTTASTRIYTRLANASVVAAVHRANAILSPRTTTTPTPPEGAAGVSSPDVPATQVGPADADTSPARGPARKRSKP